MRFYEFENYKDVINHYIKKNEGVKGFQTLLASETLINRSYLSQVIHGDVHLTVEQGMNISKFLGFLDYEVDYFMALLGRARAGNTELAKYYEEKLLEAKKMLNSSIGKVKSSVRASDGPLDPIYHTSWIYQAILKLLEVPGINTVSSIAEKLETGEDSVQKSLEVLTEVSLARFNSYENVWESLIPKTTIKSTLDPNTAANYFRQFRDRGLNKLLTVEKRKRDTYSYNSICLPMNRSEAIEALGEIRALCEKLVDISNRKTEKEDVFCFNFDQFHI